MALGKLTRVCSVNQIASRIQMLDAQLLEYEDCDQPESLYYDYLRPDYVEVNISVVWLHKIKRI